jgi:hypothetical protein
LKALKSLKITTLEDYNEWKEIIINAKEEGLTTDYARYIIALLQKENEKKSTC